MYSGLAEHLPKPKLSGQSFIDVYEGVTMLSGLSANCNPETIKLADEVIELLNPRNGISINFYKPERRKFEERIIFKYAAKKLMEPNHIDVVILARVVDGNIDLRKFQMQLAQKLRILENEGNDDDGSGLLGGCSSKTNPGITRKTKFLVHTNAICWDLACAQVQEYTLSQWSTLEGGVIRDTLFQFFDTNNIMECIANFPWLYYMVLPTDWRRCWLAEGSVIKKPLDMSNRLKLVDALLNDLYELGLAFDEFLIPEFYQRCLTINQDFSSCEELTHFEHFEKICLISPDYTIESWGHLINTQKFLKLSTLHISEIGSISSSTFPDDFFEKTEKLRVLSFSNSKLSSLPCSITYLGETLKFFSLSGCQNLDPDSLSCIQVLKKLEILDLSFTFLNDLPVNIFQGLERLQILDLTKSRIKSLPSSVSCLQNLQHFLLGGCSELSLLPDSFFHHMKKLQLLNLNSCTSLNNVTPSFRQVSKSLIELDISNCTSLENYKEVSSSVGDTLPSLEVLHCSNVKLDKLFSLNGCPNLNTLSLGGNKNVEVLDISGTQLNKFCIEESLPDLKHMDIVGTKCLLRAVDWKLIKWLPQEVNWNEFGEENRSEFRVYIAVSSDIVFKTLESTSQLWEEHFSQFHICLFPSNERGKEKRMFVPRGRTHYNDIYMRTKSPSFPYYDRFLECAGGGKRFPKYISNVLGHTQFLSLYDDRSIKRLSDLQVQKMAELKECWIEKCYSMETVFDLKSSDLVKPEPILGCLEKLRISEVMKARNMCIIPGSLKKGSFGCLKHMHLEYCPSLMNVFTSGLCLENLEVVEIKFCARLQEVFSGKGYNVEGSFSKLHTLCFIELPVLTSIIEDVVYMPSLTKIKVKGCPKLRMLPLRCTTSNRASSSKHPVPLNVTSVVVSGEPDWWGRLQWADKNVKEHISFKSWPLLKFPRQA
ncbi:Nb-arc domain-containing disease resistance protein [Thalictrum thalictroides]|uniref:Nb-arc domain-containing disease resistance protein n=1 Tax=Thalictrum thalictroides TaxID=46969 RepID=A0A7J6XA09_THATH|nr:Nb-arc domain-containing disease resistance protein [Thalictrum thalictroides]